jgi:hypothetical protein
MNENQSQSKLALALSKAQSEIQPPKKNCEVVYSGRKFRYADLASIFEAIKVPLSKNELSITQKIEVDVLKTYLMHSSGESIFSSYALPDPSKIRPQEFGSALTYARRYSLSAIVGVASEEDDDGQEAQEVKAKPQAKAPTQAQPKNFAPQSGGGYAGPDDLDQYLGPQVTQLDELYAFVEKHNVSVEQVKSIIKMTVGSPKKSSELTPDEVSRVLSLIKKSIQSNEG